ncbi:MAG: Hsp70 family protein, partial [Pseudomonadales bacterium]
RAGHWLAMIVEETKIQLTHAENRLVALDRIERDLSVDLSRALFESSIDGLLERIRTSVTQLLNDANVGVGQVDTVFFTGGSSGIPALRQSVAAMLPTPIPPASTRSSGTRNRSAPPPPRAGRRRPRTPASPAAAPRTWH